MGFDWQRAAGTALVGIGDSMAQSNARAAKREDYDYQNAQREQASIRAEDRQYQTAMRKDKELYSLNTSREAKARKDQADAMRQSGNYSEAEIMSVESGSPMSLADQRENKELDATGMAEAQNQVKTEAQMKELRLLYPEMSDQEIHNIKREKLEQASMTAAQRNEQQVMEIMGDKEWGDLSTSDKTRLSLYGVKGPEPKVVEMTASVLEKVYSSSREEAQASYSEDNVGDNDVLMEINQKIAEKNKRLPPNKQLAKVKDHKIAREILINSKGRELYIRGVSTLTNQFPTETPDGQPISPEVAKEVVQPVAAPGADKALAGPPVEPKLTGNDAYRASISNEGSGVGLGTRVEQYKENQKAQAEINKRRPNIMGQGALTGGRVGGQPTNISGR